MGTKIAFGILVPIILTGITLGVLGGLGILSSNNVNIISPTESATSSPEPTSSPSEFRTVTATGMLTIGNSNPLGTLGFSESFLTSPNVDALTVNFADELGVTSVSSTASISELNVNASLSAWPLPVGYRTGPSISVSSQGCTGFRDSNNQIWIAHIASSTPGRTVGVVRSDVAYGTNNQYSSFNPAVVSLNGFNQSGYFWEDETNVYYVTCMGDNGNVLGSYGSKTGTTLDNTMVGFSPASSATDNFGLHVGLMADDPEYIMMGHTHTRRASIQISTDAGKNWASELILSPSTVVYSPSPALVRRTEGFVAFPVEGSGLFIRLWDGTFQPVYQVPGTSDCRHLAAAYVGGIPAVAFRSSGFQLSFVSATVSQPGSTDWGPVSPVATVSNGVSSIRLTTCNGFPFIFVSDGSNLLYAINDQLDGQGTWTSNSLGTSVGAQQANAVVQPDGILITLCDGTNVNWNWIPRQIPIAYQVTGEVSIL